MRSSRPDTIGTFVNMDTLLNGTVRRTARSMSTPSQFATDPRSDVISPAGHTWYRKAAIPV
jgi:hypothetical protein